MNRYRVFYNVKRDGKTVQSRQMLLEANDTNEARKEVKFVAWLHDNEKIVITKTELVDLNYQLS